MTFFFRPAVCMTLFWTMLGDPTMTKTLAQENVDFHAALAAPARSPEIPEADDLYGWLIGSWQLEVFDYPAPGNLRRGKGEVHFGWILEGRAVQDVWIIPPRSIRTPDLGKAGNRYGTTLRVWDPAIRAWRVTWINPVSGARNELIGRRSGKDIVQVGTDPDGIPIRWIFTDVTPDSFRWTGEALQPDGRTWKLEVEFHARRIR
jgi:hypothetical protein